MIAAYLYIFFAIKLSVPVFRFIRYQFIQSVGACRMRSFARAITLDYKERKEKGKKEAEFGCGSGQYAGESQSKKVQNFSSLFDLFPLSEPSLLPALDRLDQNFSTEASWTKEDVQFLHIAS